MGTNSSKLNQPSHNIISEEAKQKAREIHEGFDPVSCFNYGIAGRYNTGKSYFVNSIRGLKRTESGAAKVSSMDCTTEVSAYEFPNNRYPYIKIWDVPGCGVSNRPTKDYFRDYGLLAFDCLVIMTEANLSEDELNFAVEALKNNIPICFIRPKCDLDMEDLLEDGKIEEINQRTVVEFLQEINDKFLRELVTKNEALKKVPYFFISNKVLYDIVTKKPTPHRFMENRLLDHLINNIKNQRHIIDQCYEDYGLEGGDIRQESREFVINPLEDVN